MLKQIKILATLFVAFTVAAVAQTNTFPSSGNVGIGTTSPSYLLDVYGTSRFGSLYGVANGDTTPVQVGDFSVGVSTTNSYTWLQSWDGYPLILNADGNNVGIGTTSPATVLSVEPTIDGSTSGYSADKLSFFDDGTYIAGLMKFNGSMGGLFARGNTGIGIYVNPTYSHNATNDTAALFANSSGNVGIGTTSPGAKLDVGGNLKISGSGANLTFPDSTVQSTAWTGTLTGGDYAESVDVTGSRNDYEPGDVLVLDPDHPGKVLKSSERYSLAVAGVYSTRPGVVGRRQKIAKELATTEVPMAMVGIVPTKVSAENGPIKSGDVLVASSTPGYAMKGTDRSLLAGAVIGKAMNPLESGTGVIEALISLQ